MADTKITALTALTAADPANDVIPIVDVSDTTMAASGTTKKISVNNILGASGTATLASATITGDLTVDTSTLKVDSTNNRVGIGTATPTDTLDVNGRVTALRYLSSSSSASLPSFAVSAGNGIYNSGANEIGFAINSANAMKLNASGNLAFPTGKGIDFSAVTGGTGTATANVLNDYEEGTFTPTISSGATAVIFSTQDGKYTKIGRLVTIFIRIVTTAATRNGSQFIISGLPFSDTIGGSGVIGYNNSGFISTAGGNKPNLLTGGVEINFFTSSGGNFVGTAIAADVFEVRLTATYYV